MRLLLLAALLLAPLAAQAADPATVILPSNLVVALRQYLGARPYDETKQLVGVLEACVQAQLPNAQGAIVSHGECPAVTAALTAHPATPHAADTRTR